MVDEYLIGRMEQAVIDLKENQKNSVTGIHARLDRMVKRSDKIEKIIPIVAENKTKLKIHSWALRTILLSIIGALGTAWRYVAK